MLEKQGHNQNLAVIRQPIDLGSSAPIIKTDVYYSILNVEQDDIIYLHHKDIVNHTCAVKLDKLSQTDVCLAHAALCDPAPSLETPTGESKIKDIDTDPDWPVKKQKKKSTRPGPRPSTQRIAVQHMIEESNRCKKRKDYVPTQILQTLPEATSTEITIITRKIITQILRTLPEATSTEITIITRKVISQESTKNTSVGSDPLQDATPKQQVPTCIPDVTSPLQTLMNVDNPDIVNVHHEVGVPSSQKQDLEDSDTTIIYNSGDVVTDKKRRVFTTVTRGIKITKRSCMYTCPKCGIKKTSVQSIDEHYKCRHDRVQCKKCDKTFATPNSRDKQMYTHESKKHHVCSQCRKDFPFASMLNDHKGQHTKSKRYPCWWLGCKKGSSYSWDLKRHIRMHRNEKRPSRCTHCDYTNPDPRNLKQHMRTHTDETPHKCKYCGKGFRFWMQKKRHQDTYCENKP